MKSKILIISIFVSIIATLHAYSQENQIYKLKVASFIDTPYDFSDQNNNPYGFSYELTKIIMGTLQYPYEIKTINSSKNIKYNSEKLNEVLKDCDLAMSVTPLPNSNYKFSIPYVSLSYDILAIDTIQFNGIENMQSNTIIVQRGSSAQNKLEEFGEENFKYVIYVNDIHAGIKLLAEGVGDYLLCDEIASKTFSQLKTTNNIATYQSNLPTLDFCYASTNEDLINNINMAIGKVKSNNTYEIIYNKWLGAKDEKPASWYVIWILIAVVIIIIFLVCTVFLLRKLVRKATLESKKSYNKIVELHQSINLLIRGGKMEIFMYDTREMMLYTLNNEDFTRQPITKDELYSKIHFEDKKKYYNEFYRFIDGEIDILTARIRVFNNAKNKYLYYDYVVKPIYKDFTGKVYRFIYSRKDETSKIEKIQKQEELIKSFNLALKAAKLARWEFDLVKNIIRIYKKDDSSEVIIPNNKIHEFIHPSDRQIFDAYIEKALFMNEIDTIILKLKSQDNDTFKQCEISSLINYDENHNPISIYGIIKDISDINDYQQRIFELQYNMQLALEAGEMSAWTYDRLNKEFIILQGSTLNNGRMTNKEYLAFTHPEDRTILANAIEKIVSKKVEKLTVSFRMDTKGDGWKWYSCAIMPVPTDGEIKYVIGTRKDITKEVEAKELLEKRNREVEDNLNKLKLILDKLPIPIYIKDIELKKYIYINNEAEKLYFTNNGSTTTELVIQENVTVCEAVDKKILETGEDYMSYEMLQFKSGRIMNTHVKKILIEIRNKKVILAVRTDLTEKHKAQLSNKLLSKALPLLKAYTWSYTTRDNIVNFGETFIQNQRSQSEINTVDNFISIIHPEDRDICRNNIKSYIEKGSGEYTFKYRMDLLEKGVYEWWESKSVVETIHDNNGTYLFVYGVEININDKVMKEVYCEL